MAIAKVSPYRSGDPRFGLRTPADGWKPELKEYKLTPEELEAYKNGKSIDDILRERNEKQMAEVKLPACLTYLSFNRA